jgi:hypothetical protein
MLPSQKHIPCTLISAAFLGGGGEVANSDALADSYN